MQIQHSVARFAASPLGYGAAMVALAGLGVWLTDDAGPSAAPTAAPFAHSLTSFLQRGEYTTDGSAQPGAQRCGDCWHVGEGGTTTMVVP